MTDRDTFAAAALTGYTANPAWDDVAASIVAEQSYADADEMLRERVKHSVGVAEMDSAADRKSVAAHGACARSCSQPFDSAPITQPAPPCVETDGFSSSSRSGQINRSPERQSPDRECGESQLRDVPQLDNSRAAGGPEHHISDRSQPVKDCVSDRSKPINDGRLSALEELSAMDQELELKHGITGNPMIRARRNKESAGAGITDAGPRLRQMNDVLKENERLRGQLAWTERERDSLRVSINNLRDYVAELNAELYAKSDEKCVLYDTNHDAAPAARASLPTADHAVRRGCESGCGTGKQTAPPCVETDGFSHGPRTGTINRTPERQSPDRECGESQLRDVPRPDTKGKAAGGPERHISEAEIDALEFVVEEGRIANIHDYGILRSLLIRLRQEWECRDTPEPIAGCDIDRLKPVKEAAFDRPEPINVDLSQPCMVDPPSGWQWGFPKRYDPAEDGPMKEWLVRNGYPKHLAAKGLLCTFTLCGNGEADK